MDHLRHLAAPYGAASVFLLIAAVPACGSSTDTPGTCATDCGDAGTFDGTDPSLTPDAGTATETGDAAGSDASASFRVTVEPSIAQLTFGAVVSVTVRIAGEPGGAVAIAVGGLPTDVTAAPVTMAGGSGVLTLTAASEAAEAPVVATLTITATAAGGTAQTTLGLNVIPAHGALDKTFGSGGLTVTDFAGDYDAIDALASTPSGWVAAGLASVGNDLRFGVASYSIDGVLDTTFGAAADAGMAAGSVGPGRIATRLSPASTRDQATAIVVQPDGKIVVAGFDDGAALTLVRYRAEGTRDGTFGNQGQVDVPLPGLKSDASVVVARQADGKLVVAGSSHGSGATGDDLVVARVSDLGVLDPTFGAPDAGTPGVAVVDLGGSSDEVNAMAVLSSGKILLAGTTSFGNSPDTKAALTRLDADGSLDVAYGGSDAGAAGTVRSFDGQGYEQIRCIAPLGSDRFIVAWNGSSTNAYLSRIDATGALDPAFGVAGKAQLVVPTAQSVFVIGTAIQADGKIIAVGSATVQGPGNATFPLVVARFDAGGAIDTSFGTDGYVVKLFGGGTAIAHAVVIQPDGRIVVGGSVETTALNDDFAIARFWP